VLLFLGGWRWPEMPFDGVLMSALSVIWFLAKTTVVIWVIFWIRGTYPRLRIDQLMSFGWKMLVPLSFINIVITAIVLFYGWPLWTLTVLSLLLLGGTFYLIVKNPGTSIERDTVTVHAISATYIPPAPAEEVEVAAQD
jgi:hypothetical protein